MKNIKLVSDNVTKSFTKAFLILAIIIDYISGVTTTILASGIADSKLATGTQKLVEDATTWLMVLSPIIGVLLIIYFFIRRSISDEIDIKKWNNRILVTIISCIGAVLASVMLNIIITYYA